MAENTWVLDLSSDPPDIYNSAITEHAHNAFEPPYPSIFWYVDTEHNDINHLGELNYHSPCFSYPYPSIFWYVNDNKNDVLNSSYRDPEPMGAFKDCSNLQTVSIPFSVNLIGSYAFWNTALTEVSLSRDCLYDSNTSFPEDCKVEVI